MVLIREWFIFTQIASNSPQKLLPLHNKMLTEYRHFRLSTNKMTAWKAAVPGTVSLFFFSLEYFQARHVSSPPKNGYI